MKNVVFFKIKMNTLDIVFLKYVIILFGVENIRSGEDMLTPVMSIALLGENEYWGRCL